MADPRLVQKAPTVRLGRAALEPGVAAPVVTLDLGVGAGWGWAVRWDRERVASGADPLRREEPAGARLARFRRWLRDLMALTRLRLVVYLRPEPGDGADAHRLEGLLLAEIEGQVDFVVPSRAELAEHATGRAGAASAEVVEAARARWVRHQLPEAEAHALCLLAWAADSIAP